MVDETSVQDPVEVQDFANPFDKFKRNPNRDDIFKQIQRKKAEQKIIAGSKTGATRKERIAARKAVAETTTKPIDRLRSGQVWKYIEDITPTFKYIEPDPDQLAELEAKQIAAEWNQEDVIKQTAKQLDKAIEAPNIKFGGYGEEIPGTGMLISSITRGLMQTGAAVTDEFAKVLQSATAIQTQIAQDNRTLYPELYTNSEKSSEIKNPIGEFGEWLSNETELAKQITAQMGGDKAKRPIIQRVGEVVGGLTGRLPSMLLIAEAGGPIIGFGTMQAMQARARGVTDPKELALEFTWGAIKGKVFNAVGKSAEWMEKAGIAKQGGSFFATGTQSTAQFITGVGEQAIETSLHPNLEKPDAFDYLAAGLTNTLLDPLLLPGGTRKAQGAIETQRKFEGANLELPEVIRPYSNKDLFNDDVPIENITTLNLLKRSKARYVSEQNVMWLNPAAGTIVARAAAALGNSQIADTEGVVFTTGQIHDLANLFGEKSIQIQEMIKGIEEPTKDVNGLVEAAILYESLAEHLTNATENRDQITIRFAGKGNEDLAVIGHEKIHESQMIVAKNVGTSLYDVQHPNFLLEHPLGAKFISEHGDLLDNYKTHQWTAETMAYVAQPGNNLIKLSVEERGILFGDYLADIANRHGSKSLSNFDVTWADREVARNAFTRLAQRNYVELKKDKGIPVGLIWKNSDYRPMMQQGGRLVNGGEVQPPMMIGDMNKLNQAIKANDFLWRLKDSKVKHPDGELIKVKHGSPTGREIIEVDFSLLNKTDWIKGFFTTQSSEVADSYSEDGGFGTASVDLTYEKAHKELKRFVSNLDSKYKPLKYTNLTTLIDVYNNKSAVKFSDFLKEPDVITDFGMNAADYANLMDLAQKREAAYLNRGGKNIHEFYLDIKNPLNLDANLEFNAIPEELTANLELYKKLYADLEESLSKKYGESIESVKKNIKQEELNQLQAYDTKYDELYVEINKYKTSGHPILESARAFGVPESVINSLTIGTETHNGVVARLVSYINENPEKFDATLNPETAVKYEKLRDTLANLNKRHTILQNSVNELYNSVEVNTDIFHGLKSKQLGLKESLDEIKQIEGAIESYTIHSFLDIEETMLIDEFEDAYDYYDGIQSIYDRYANDKTNIGLSRMVGSLAELNQELVRREINTNTTSVKELLPIFEELTKKFKDNKKSFQLKLDSEAFELRSVGEQLMDVTSKLLEFKPSVSTGIDVTREILLKAGYDGATHLGGKRKIEKFTDKIEAERYARETGGRFEVISNFNLELSSDYRTFHEKLTKIDNIADKAFSLLAKLENTTKYDLYASTDLFGQISDNIQFIEQLKTRGVYEDSKIAAYSDTPIEDLTYLRDTLKRVYKEGIDTPQIYKVSGHRVWIAFKPEQVISTTGTYPIVEPFFDGLEYQKEKLKWESNRIVYEAKRQELLKEAQATLTDWKQNEAAKLLSEWKIEYSNKAPIEDPYAFDLWIDDQFAQKYKTDDDFDVPLSIKPPVEGEGNFASSTENKSTLEQFYLIEEEYKDISKQHIAKGDQIRKAGGVTRYLYKMKNAGIDVSAALKFASTEITRLQNERKLLADEKIKLKNILAKSWVPIADDYKKVVDLSINSELEEGTKRYLDQIDKATEKVKEINENPEKLNLSWKEGLDQDIIKLVNFKLIGEFGADIMKSLGIELQPTKDKPVYRQLMEAYNLGAIDIEKFDEGLAKYGMTMAEMVGSFAFAAKNAGQTLQILKVIKADLSKMMKDSPETLGPNLQKLYKDIPELQMWFENNTPSMAEIKSLVKGRNNIMRFISINNGAALLTMATQATNFVISSAKLLGKGFENYFEAIENRIRTGHYDSLLPNGEIEQKVLKPNTIVDSFRPVFEVAGILNYVTGVDKSHSIGRYITSLKDGVKWMDDGTVPSKRSEAETKIIKGLSGETKLTVGRPSTRGERAIDIITHVQKVFPKTYDQLFAALNGDFESMDIPLLEQTLNTMKRQLEFSPDSPMKERKLKEITIQQTNIATEGGQIAKNLRGGEYTVHKLMLLGRGPERVLRTAAFVGQLDYYAKRYGQDIHQLAKDGRLHEIHPDALVRATNDALEITYGIQPKNSYDGSAESMYASYLKFLRAGDNPASIALNVIQPYQNFVVQATKEAFNWSPLAIFRYYKLFTDTKSTLIADGDYRQFNKFFIGTLAYTFFYFRANEKYEEAERNKQPPPNASWDDLGGFSMKGTPLGPMMFVADTKVRHERGLPMSEKNWVRALGNLAVDFRGVTGIFDWMDGFWERFSKGSDKIGDDLKNELSLQIGQWMSKFAIPLKNYSDFAGELDKDQKTLKDIYGWGYGNLVTPTLDKLPSSFIKPDGTRMHLRDLLYDRIDPYTGKPMMRNHPAARALTGFNLVPEQSKLNKLMVMQGISYSDWIPYSGIPEVDRELIKDIVKFTPELAKKYEEGAMNKLHIDQQTTLVMEILKEYSAEALDMALVNFPDVRQKMEDNQELNKWERRVLERNMKAKTGKAFSDIYESLKAKRITTENMLDIQRTLDIDITGKGTWTIKE